MYLNSSAILAPEKELDPILTATKKPEKPLPFLYIRKIPLVPYPPHHHGHHLSRRIDSNGDVVLNAAQEYDKIQPSEIEAILKQLPPITYIGIVQPPEDRMAIYHDSQ